jgi:hypothetical protein
MIRVKMGGAWVLDRFPISGGGNLFLTEEQSGAFGELIGKGSERIWECGDGPRMKGGVSCQGSRSARRMTLERVGWVASNIILRRKQPQIPERHGVRRRLSHPNMSLLFVDTTVEGG